jgi:hypothetical protein
MIDKTEKMINEQEERGTWDCMLKLREREVDIKDMLALGSAGCR